MIVEYMTTSPKTRTEIGSYLADFVDVANPNVATPC